MNTLSTIIPDLFYDIISRMIPGVTAIAGLVILLVLSGTLIIDSAVITYISSINFLLLVLLLAYLTGLLLGTLAQVLDEVFRYGYNPAVDYLKINGQRKRGKQLIYYLEILIGVPFSLFLLKNYRSSRSDNYIADLKKAIKKRFGESVLDSHMNFIACKDYISLGKWEAGGVTTKMAAESNMCRNLVVVFLLLFFLSLYYSLESAATVSALLCTLSFTNFSIIRRRYVTKVYDYFYAIEKSENQKVPVRERSVVSKTSRP